MPRTLTAEAPRPPERHHDPQQARFDRFGREYHHARPPEARGQRTPAALSLASPRRLPATLAEPQVPGHGLGRHLRNAGTCRLNSRPLFLRDTWLQAWVALAETGDGLGSISFDDVLLARLDARDFTLRG
jgi:hypothetical protein